MSEVIQLLEALGQQAGPGPVSDADLRDAVDRIELAPELRSALLARDVVALNRLLKGRTNLMLLLAPAESETPAEPESEPAPTDDEPKQDESSAA